MQNFSQLLQRLADSPLPPARVAAEVMARPGGAGRTADDAHVRRGVGLAIGFKNLLFSEGFDATHVAQHPTALRDEDVLAIVRVDIGGDHAIHRTGKRAVQAISEDSLDHCAFKEAIVLSV